MITTMRRITIINNKNCTINLFNVKYTIWKSEKWHDKIIQDDLQNVQC